MGTACSITLVNVTPCDITAAAEQHFCFLSDGVPVGYLFWPMSLNRPHLRDVDVALPDIARLLSDCVVVVGGDVVAGFHLFVASDMLQPHRFTLTVPAMVRDHRSPRRLVDNTNRLPMLTQQYLTGCRCDLCVRASASV